jgi:hypothetical protein
MGLVTKIDWPTERRSEQNFDFDFLLLTVFEGLTISAEKGKPFHIVQCVQDRGKRVRVVRWGQTTYRAWKLRKIVCRFLASCFLVLISMSRVQLFFYGTCRNWMRRFASTQLRLASIALVFGQRRPLSNSALILNLQSTKAPGCRKGERTESEFPCAKLVSEHLQFRHRKASILLPLLRQQTKQ